MRIRVYVDGFSLYYGRLKGTDYKWLDLLTLFQAKVLPTIIYEGAPLVSSLNSMKLDVRYFTAAISEKAAKDDRSVARQDAYVRALEANSPGNLVCFPGKFQITPAFAPSRDPDQKRVSLKNSIQIPIWKVEEKKTDVHLALQVLRDCMAGLIDHAVIVSNDTDLTPVFDMVRQETSIPVGFISTTRPGSFHNRELEAVASWSLETIPDHALAQSQLPHSVLSKTGRRSHLRPLAWYPNADVLKIVFERCEVSGISQGKFQRWLHSDNRSINGSKPVELLESETPAELIPLAEDWMDSKRA